MDFTQSGPSASDDLLINVNGSDDPCYRYKMHPISIKNISKNGGMTVIENAEQIAHDIYRELSDLKSCFAKGVAGRVQVNGHTLAIPGNYTQDALKEILNRYIANDVLCKKCGNPETVLWKKRKRRCNACGHVLDA